MTTLALREMTATGLLDPSATFQVNISTDPSEPYWQTIVDLSECDDATADDYDCDGCLCTLHLLPGIDNDPGDAAVWHMTLADTDRAEFRRI